MRYVIIVESWTLDEIISFSVTELATLPVCHGKSYGTAVKHQPLEQHRLPVSTSAPATCCAVAAAAAAVTGCVC